ncbi:hypothetical protein K493DRAFT_295966 [Basidiobolus meristosporus CBS 931.73]|uniref:Uncharacterized protein n=1 Tax=Basidiobolus meristosporus CBS 931.73 TaxID=1314790 RepID=A0A1Y1Z9H5_9FUNG|nr:hypothetical protein K493DRAFT_295966 [Basidiobolus meristosporus CBS 931.73]|eukprot:ORY06435.1 hypothetical protein K493DRAFT_295966 [Basidiobolus meristosporus CBS 931.73]
MVLPPLGPPGRDRKLWLIHTITALATVGSLTAQQSYAATQIDTPSKPSVNDISTPSPNLAANQASVSNFGVALNIQSKSQAVKKVGRSGKTIVKKVYRPGKIIRKTIPRPDTKKKRVDGKTAPKPSQQPNAVEKPIEVENPINKKILLPGKDAQKEIKDSTKEKKVDEGKKPEATPEKISNGSNESSPKQVVSTADATVKNTSDTMSANEKKESTPNNATEGKKESGKGDLTKTPPEENKVVKPDTNIAGNMEEYNGGKRDTTTILKQEPLLDNKEVLLKTYIPGKTLVTKVPVGPTYATKKTLIPGQITYKDVEVPGKTIVRKVPYGPTYKSNQVVIPGKKLVQRVKLPGETRVRKILLGPTYGKKKVYEQSNGESASGVGYKQVKIPGEVRIKRVKSQPLYAYEDMTIPGESKYKVVRVPNKTLVYKTATPAEYTIQKVLVPGKKVIQPNPGSTKDVVIKKYISEEYGFKFTETPGSYVIRRKLTPGQSIKKKVVRSPQYGYKVVSVTGEPVKVKVRVPGEIIATKVRVPAEYGYKKVYIPGVSTIKRFKVVSGSKKIPYLKKPVYKYEKHLVPGEKSIRKFRIPGQTIRKIVKIEPKYIYKKIPRKVNFVTKKIRVPAKTFTIKVPTREEYGYTRYLSPSGFRIAKTRIPGKRIAQITRIPARFGYNIIKQHAPPRYRKIYVPGRTIVQKVRIQRDEVTAIDLPPVQEYVEEYFDSTDGIYKHRLQRCSWDIRQSQYDCKIKENSVDETLESSPDFEEETYVPPAQRYIEEYVDRYSGETSRHLKECIWRPEIKNTVCTTKDLELPDTSSQRYFEPGTTVTNIYLPPDRVYIDEYLDKATNSMERRLRVCTWDIKSTSYKCSSKDMDDNSLAISPGTKESTDENMGLKVTTKAQACTSTLGGECEINQKEFGNFKPLSLNGPNDPADIKLYSGLTLQDIYWPEIDPNALVADRVFIYEFVDQAVMQTERRVVVCKYDAYSQSWTYASISGEILSTPLNMEETSEDDGTIVLVNGKTQETVYIPPKKEGYTIQPADRIYIQEYFDESVGISHRRSKICIYLTQLQNWKCQEKTEKIDNAFTATVHLPPIEDRSMAGMDAGSNSYENILQQEAISTNPTDAGQNQYEICTLDADGKWKCTPSKDQSKNPLESASIDLSFMNNLILPYEGSTEYQREYPRENNNTLDNIFKYDSNSLDNEISMINQMDENSIEPQGLTSQVDGLEGSFDGLAELLDLGNSNMSDNLHNQ